MTITLVIARHGNTFSTGQTPTRVGARTDLPLVNSGEDQALRLGLALKNARLVPVHVFTSQLQRTIATARLACVSMACSSLNEPLGFLNEIDYGPDENKTEDKVVDRIGHKALEDWDGKGLMPVDWSPRPETIVDGWADFLARLRAEFDGKTVLVVTSNGIARFAAQCTVNGQDFPLKLSTGCYGILKYNGSDWLMTEWNTRP